jgi:hypothetical protein
MQSARAGLPHLPKGDRLLESHARNSAKSHSQSEYGIRHRLTERPGPAGLIRKVAWAAYQRVKQRPRSAPTAPRLPPASAEVAVAFTFEHPDVFSGAQPSIPGRECPLELTLCHQHAQLAFRMASSAAGAFLM